MTPLQQIVDDTGTIPLAWAGGGGSGPFVNVGDALSPVMVALCTGRSVRHAAARSSEPRMAAVGTIGHGLAGGEVWTWGTGADPKAAQEIDLAIDRPVRATVASSGGGRLHLAAARGPISAAVLSGTEPPRAGTVFGDPVALLPRFYAPAIEPTHELGVIVHISELNAHRPGAGIRPDLTRYEVPADFASSIRLIDTMCEPTAEAIRAKIDEILSCRRILSTSLHGLVLAEVYGRPCLHFQQGLETGVFTIDLPGDGPLDARMRDYYLGLGATHLPLYRNRIDQPTDWEAAIDAIDAHWRPHPFHGDPLVAALPVRPDPVRPPADGSVFDLPLIRDLPFLSRRNPVQRLLGKARVLVRGTDPAR